MVMKLHTGVPGAGKTYLLVKNFIDLFCTWDKETGRFVLKEKHKDKVLVSNIEGLTLPHYDIETLMSERCLQLARVKYLKAVKKHDPDEMEDVIDEYYRDFMEEKVRWFFDYSFQKHLAAKYGPLIYLIEESQRYFDTKELGRQKWVRDVHFFFEKHRHFGFSIFMDTQHASKLSKGIAVLFETETRAKPRTLSLMGEFKYNEYSDGSKTNQVPIVVKPDKRVYAAYKSMSHKEDVKTKKPVLKLMVFVVAMICASIFMINYAKSNLGPGEVHAKSNNSGTSAAGSASAPAPAYSNPGSWVHLPFVMDASGNITVVHPITYAVVPLDEFDLQIKRQGTQLYCFIEDDHGR